MTADDDSDHYYLGVHKDAFRRYRMFNEINMPGTASRLADLPLTPDMHILEVGCGIGDTARYFAQNVVPDGHVTAFDQASDIVKIAEKEARDAGISNITFICAHAQDFDYGLDRFDFAHSRYVLSYSPDAASIVASILGALKPKGMFLGEEVAQSYVKHGKSDWIEKLEAWFTALIEHGGGHPNYGLEQLPSDMITAGFENLHVNGFWPMQDQEEVVAMLRLALSNEMRPNLVALGVATDAEIDAVLAAAQAPGKDFIVSAAAAIQVVGYKPWA
ncbi:MAG: class I SAM-dependent methyltransferase [Pseudomonadota bacterium]